MSRYTGPRLRIIRRLGQLPSFTKKRIKYYRVKRKWQKKNSASLKYSIRLKEKQKLRYNYGINERQLLNYVRQARLKKGSTGELLLQFLEMRLDCIIYRSGFAPTIPAARQFITHGHILVNKKRVNIPSYICKTDDFISVFKKSFNFIKKKSIYLRKNSTSEYLNVNHKKLETHILTIIPRNLVKLYINELLVIEYYSRKL
uniref:Small ribosomal subunit protein uS4c n=1 Tax=Prototheca wickerhamii TaxID=3111 RepID=A0A873HX26_PROWI|nr:ribosomal protein S4 [Prototheca wickerhamii]QOZ41710.1 ribosomal protein S4 [Prototheca wickerhamii]